MCKVLCRMSCPLEEPINVGPSWPPSFPGHRGGSCCLGAQSTQPRWSRDPQHFSGIIAPRSTDFNFQDGGLSVGAQHVKNPRSIHEDAGLIPGPSQWVKDLVATRCHVGHRCGSDLVFLWLWCRTQLQLQLIP